MNNMKLILIEDEEQDINLCKVAVNDFNEDNGCQISIEPYKDVDSAINALRGSYYDGAIVDMRLADAGDEGNLVLDEIKKQLSRIPVAIMTGTPDGADVEDIPLVGKYTKGDALYSQIIESFWNIYKTGLTRIMGGKGEIEKSLSQIFIKNLLPQVALKSETETSNWVHHANTDPENTEKALLRHTLNHLMHHLYSDMSLCYPDEMYLSPMQQRINTGCILKRRDEQKFYIVMNPACDLAERENGGCNTDRALLAEIQMLEEIFGGCSGSDWENNLSKSQKSELRKIRKNNQSLYYHWLPSLNYYNHGSIDNFHNGGVINFRWLSTYSEEELETQFEGPIIQISGPFLKDMVSRFSSYYARQGQPDISYPTS